MIIQKICANTVVKESGMVLWNDRNKLRFEVSRACQQKGGVVACIVCDSWRERVATHRISKGLNFILFFGPLRRTCKLLGRGSEPRHSFNLCWSCGSLAHCAGLGFEPGNECCRGAAISIVPLQGPDELYFIQNRAWGIQRKFMELRGGLNIQDQGAINPLVCFYNIDIFVITILKIKQKQK